MKRFFLASASVIALNYGAVAADLPSRVQAPVFAVPPTFTWSGFYIGGFVGGAFSNQKTKTTTDDSGDGWSPYIGGPNAVDSTDGQSFQGLIGATVGYNYQMGNIVLGLEADGAWLSRGKTQTNSATNAYPYNYGCGCGSTGIGTESAQMSNSFSVRSLTTVRGRFGFALDRTLIFATGGLAIGNVKGRTSTSYNYAEMATLGCGNASYSEVGGATWDGSASKTMFGFAVGGGVEHALTEHVTLKLDALYYNLGSMKVSAVGQGGYTYSYNCNCSNGSDISGGKLTAKKTIDGVAVRAGMNYKF